MLAFTKLLNSLPESSVWCAPYPTRIVWVTMLAAAGPDGIVRGSIPGLAKRAAVTLDECKTALDYFLSPDEYSGSPEYEGRRIEVVEGGWRLLNYLKYRNMRDDEMRRENNRDRQRRFRENRNGDITHRNACNASSPQEEEEGEEEKTMGLSPLSPEPATKPSPSEFPATWNSLCGSLPKVKGLSDSRRMKVQARIRQGLTLSAFGDAVRRCAATPFLRGESERGWRADFDWLIANDTNMMKVMEGKYDGAGGVGAAFKVNPLAGVKFVNSSEGSNAA